MYRLWEQVCICRQAPGRVITQGHEYPTDSAPRVERAGTLAALLKDVLVHPEGAVILPSQSKLKSEG